MIRINLLPREEKPSREVQSWNRVFIWALISAAVVVIVGVGIHVFRSYEIANLKSDIAETRRELAKYEGQAALVRDLTARRQAIQQRIQVIENLDKDRFLRVQVLDELVRSVPDYVWLESAEEKAGAITVKGMAFSNLAVSEFMNELDAKAHVDSVYLRVIRQDEVEDQTVLAFEMGYKIPVTKPVATPAPDSRAKPQGSRPAEGAKTR
jgi:type IV pilus assembly protein PilN